MRTKFNTTLTTLFLILFPVIMYSQVFSSKEFPKIKPDPYSVFFACNIGGSTTGTIWDMQGNMTIKNHLYRLEFYDSYHCEYPAEQPKYGYFSPAVPFNKMLVQSIHLCYGYIFPGAVWLSVTAGVSYSTLIYKIRTIDNVTVNNPGNFIFPSYFSTNRIITDKENRKIAFGIPIDIKFHSLVHHAFGLDFTIKADINTVNPMFGVGFGYRFGRIAAKKF